MLKYYILAATLVTLGGSLTLTAHPKQKFIKEIKEGPYQNYSGQPLVDLGGKYYFFETNLPSTWLEASSFCRSLDLYLVSIEDAVENELIVDYVLTNIGHRNFWTSGSDSAQEGQFVWTSTGFPVTFTDWHAGQPDNEHGEQHTLIYAYWPSDGFMKWDDTVTTAAPIYTICEEQII